MGNARAQGSIEFFLIAGFILLATSVLLTQADRQISGTSALNNVLIARSALDLEASTLKYVYFSGSYTSINHKIFIPVGAQCFYIAGSRLACIVPGAGSRVVGEQLETPVPSVEPSCHKSGWVSITTINQAGMLNVSCT